MSGSWQNDDDDDSGDSDNDRNKNLKVDNNVNTKMISGNSSSKFKPVKKEFSANSKIIN